MAEVLKSATTTNPRKLAGAIFHVIVEKQEKVEIISIGAGAINQASKAIAIASGFASPRGKKLNTIISFDNVDIPTDSNEEVSKTAIKFTVEGQNV